MEDYSERKSRVYYYRSFGKEHIKTEGGLNNQTGYTPTTFELEKLFNSNIKSLIDALFHDNRLIT
jgi:hypothetical protein